MGHPLPPSCALLAAPFGSGPLEEGGTERRAQTLTLQAEMTPSPPAHTIVSFTMLPHQSLWVHVA